jgi:hypothetical protein
VSSDVALVVANGCSMTYGDELTDRLQTCWASVLARSLGADVVNLGACAGSNRRIVRTTVEQLDRCRQARGLEPSQVLMLSMWSRLNRFELYGHEPDRQGGLATSFDDADWCRIHPAYIERRDQRTITWYKHLQTDVGDRSGFVLDWIIFDHWLMARGYPHGFIWAFDPPPSGLFAGIEHYEPLLDTSSLLGAKSQPQGGPSFYSFGVELGDLGPGRHPLERAHADFAEQHLYPWVQELLAGQP